MSEEVRSRLLNVVWVVVPSVLWNCVVHSVALCLDPLLIQAVQRGVPRWLGIGLRAVWVCGFGVALLAEWNITPGSYLFYMREALPFSPVSVLAGLAVAIAVLGWLLFSRRAQPASGPLSRAMLLVGLALLVLKSATGAGWLDIQWVDQHVRAPFITSARMVLSTVNQDPDTSVNSVPEATFNAFVRGQHTLPSKIVVMVVESWGEQEGSLKQMGAEIQSEGLQVLTSGFTTYRGSTLSGEFRELCSTYLVPTDGLKDRASHLDCAPAFLQRNGYKISGLHGFRRAFYSRESFWNRFGITDGKFREDLAGLEACPGPFEGTCDTALVKHGIDILDSEAGKSFVYMLTLSSHEPLEPSALKQSAAFFNDVAVVHPTQIVTRRAISDLIVELTRRQDRPCTLVYVAGDHQPPSASARNGVFESNQVPFLAFTHQCGPDVDGKRVALTAAHGPQAAGVRPAA